MKTMLVMLLMIVPSAGCQHAKSASDRYIDKQLAVIEAHKKTLITAGRITDPEHFQAELYLASYAWHSDCGTSSGPTASLISCNGGFFGAYSFSARAFEQAKKIYVIHGEMLAGTDILIDASFGECIPEKGGGCIIGSTSGYTSPRGKGAFDVNAVGYTVPSLTYCMKYGAHYEHCDGLGDSKDFTESAKIIKFIDGGHVQLDHKAKYDAEMYGMVIVPPDYVDMCQCTTPMHVEAAPPSKPCVQGGSLAPGESCSVSVQIQ